MSPFYSGYFLDTLQKPARESEPKPQYKYYNKIEVFRGHISYISAHVWENNLLL